MATSDYIKQGEPVSTAKMLSAFNEKEDKGHTHATEISSYRGVWSDTADYAVNEMVYSNGMLFVCRQAHTVASGLSRNPATSTEVGGSSGTANVCWKLFSRITGTGELLYSLFHTNLTAPAINDLYVSMFTTSWANSGYLSIAQFNEKIGLNGKQNTLTAGSNIQISNNVISATNTVYSHPNEKQCSYAYSHPTTIQCSHTHSDYLSIGNKPTGDGTIVTNGNLSGNQTQTLTLNKGWYRVVLKAGGGSNGSSSGTAGAGGSLTSYFYVPYNGVSAKLMSGAGGSGANGGIGGDGSGNGANGGQSNGGGGGASVLDIAELGILFITTGGGAGGTTNSGGVGGSYGGIAGGSAGGGAGRNNINSTTGGGGAGGTASTTTGGAGSAQLYRC
jgi:hypothetical protein